MRPRPRLTVLALALATPLLILVGLSGLLLRQGSDRLQVIPVLAIGTGLLVQSAWLWRRRRRALLRALKDPALES
jgi:hypothetical protein